MSEAAKHTPGPWDIIRDRQHPSNRRINSPKRWHIAKVYAESAEDDPVCLANAHLIAAAPCMLAALKAVVEWHGERGRNAGDALLPADQQEHEIAEAMRAIARAESTLPADRKE